MNRHFRIPYQKRKEHFYRKIIFEILWNTKHEREQNIIEIVKDILFIYSKKREEKEHLEWLLNDFECEESKKQEEIGYLIDFHKE